MKKILIPVLALALMVLGIYGVASAQDNTRGTSITSLPENSGKVDEVHAFLKEKFGDSVKHWTEEVVVTYPDGEKLEVIHYFERPHNVDTNNALTEMITGLPYISPEEKDTETETEPSATILALNCLRLHDHWYYLGEYFESCGQQGSQKAENSFGSAMNERTASYYESLPSGAVKLYDNINLSGYLGELLSDTAVMPVGMRDNSSSGYFYY